MGGDHGVRHELLVCVKPIFFHHGTNAGKIHGGLHDCEAPAEVSDVPLQDVRIPWIVAVWKTKKRRKGFERHVRFLGALKHIVDGVVDGFDVKRQKVFGDKFVLADLDQSFNGSQAHLHVVVCPNGFFLYLEEFLFCALVIDVLVELFEGVGIVWCVGLGVFLNEASVGAVDVSDDVVVLFEAQGIGGIFKRGVREGFEFPVVLDDVVEREFGEKDGRVGIEHVFDVVQKVFFVFGRDVEVAESGEGVSGFVDESVVFSQRLKNILAGNVGQTFLYLSDIEFGIIVPKLQDFSFDAFELFFVGRAEVIFVEIEVWKGFFEPRLQDAFVDVCRFEDLSVCIEPLVIEEYGVAVVDVALEEILDALDGHGIDDIDHVVDLESALGNAIFERIIIGRKWEFGGIGGISQFCDVENTKLQSVRKVFEDQLGEW